MLVSFQFKNFKSLINETPIKLTEYSILCGSNSSGKSSIIQALLMLSQTFSSRFSQGTIALNGHLVRLGAFGDIKNYKSSDGNISISFELCFRDVRRWSGDLESIACDFSFGDVQARNNSVEDELHPSVLKASFKIKKRDGVIDELEFQNPAFYADQLSAALNLYKVTNVNLSEADSISKEFPDYKVLGCGKDSFIPSELELDYDYTKKISVQVIESFLGHRRNRWATGRAFDDSKIILPRIFFQRIKALIDSERQEVIRNFEFTEDLKTLIDASKRLGQEIDAKSIRDQVISYRLGITSDIIADEFLAEEHVPMSDWLLFLNTMEGSRRKSLVEFIDKHRTTLQDAWYHGVKKERRVDTYRMKSFSNAAVYMHAYFERCMKYLGPLRNEPQPNYPALGLAEPTNVGMKGEFSAAILHINKSKRIRYPSPANSDQKTLRLKYASTTLDQACEDWLSYLGVVENVQTSDKGKLGYELSVKTHCDDSWQDLTHVGVGVSQVLPIVLMSLLSEEDDLLIFEQPELHLHPKIQSRLCDFFIAISSWRRQCLIETHSEYLINRLRLRIVQSDDGSLRENSSIFFLNKKNGVTNFKTVNVTEFGAVQDWPEDFFDQTDIEVENILMESTKKMKRLKSKGIL